MPGRGNPRLQAAPGSERRCHGGSVLRPANVHLSSPLILPSAILFSFPTLSPPPTHPLYLLHTGSSPTTTPPPGTGLTLLPDHSSSLYPLSRQPCRPPSNPSVSMRQMSPFHCENFSQCHPRQQGWFCSRRHQVEQCSNCKHGGLSYLM